MFSTEGVPSLQTTPPNVHYWFFNKNRFFNKTVPVFSVVSFSVAECCFLLCITMGRVYGICFLHRNRHFSSLNWHWKSGILLGLFHIPASGYNAFTPARFPLEATPCSIPWGHNNKERAKPLPPAHLQSGSSETFLWQLNSWSTII